MKLPKAGRTIGILGASILFGLLARSLFISSSDGTDTVETTPTFSEDQKGPEFVYEPETPLADTTPLPTLSVEESLAKLNAWMESPHAMAQQFELYDAVGRSQLEDFPAIDATLLGRDNPLNNEARSTLIARWLYESPGSLLQHRHAMAGRWRGSSYYNLDTLFRILVSDSVSATHSLLQKLENEDAELGYEYRAFYQALLSQQPSEETKAAMLFAIDGASRVGISLEQTRPQQATVAAVKQALQPDALATDPRQARNLFNQLSQSDVDAAMQLALEIEEPTLRNDLLNIALPRYAKSNPADTVWVIGEIFESGNRNTFHGLSNALAIALETDPSAANLWYEGAESPEKANARLYNFLRRGGNSRPGLLPLINRLPPSQIRDQHMTSALNTLAYQDIGKAEDWIAQNLDANEAERYRLGIIGPSFRNDPDATIEFFNALPNSPEKIDATRQFIAMWASKDFDAAIDWATQNTDPQSRRMALQTLSHVWSETDLDSAIAFLNQETDPETSHAFQDAISRSMLNYQSPEEALAYLDGLPENAHKDAFYHQAFDSIAVKDPLAALSAVQSRNLDPQSTLNAYQTIAHRWLRLDPEVAAPTLLTAGGEITRSSLNAIANTYQTYDPIALQTLSSNIADPQLRQEFQAAIEQSRHRFDHAFIH